MSRGPSAFRQRDLTRALKGAQAAEVEVARIEIEIGKIIIITGKPIEANGGTSVNEWDEVNGDDQAAVR